MALCELLDTAPGQEPGVPMSKTKPEPVSTPGPSMLVPERDLKPLKRVLLEVGVTFEGAVRRYQIGAGDWRAIMLAAQEATNIMSRNQAVTIAHMAYWELFDEREM